MKRLYAIPVGSQLILDTRRWNVNSVVGGDIDVTCDADGTFTTLTVDRVETAIRNGTCEVITPVAVEKRRALNEFTGGFITVDQLPQEEQEVVRDRLLLVQAMIRLEAEGEKLTQCNLSHHETVARLRGLMRRILEDDHRLSRDRARGRVALLVIPKGRTLQKYLNLYRKFDSNPIVLMQRDHLKGGRGEAAAKLDRFQEMFLRYALEHWLKPVKAKMAPLFRDARAYYMATAKPDQLPLRFPSLTTFRTRVAALSKSVKTIAREGIRKAKNQLGAGSTDVRATIFGERVEADEVLLSIFVDKSGKTSARLRKRSEVKDKLEKGEIARTWLHVMIDIATRMPLAWVMSAAPSADHTLALYRMAMRDKTREAERYGCTQTPAPPVRVALTSADNGLALRSGPVRGAQLGLGGAVEDRRTFHSTDSPYIERLFGTLQWGVLNFQGGYVGSRPGELPGYDPKEATTLTPDALYGIITRYFVDEYPFRPHDGTGMFGMTPMQKLEQVLGNSNLLEPPSPQERRLHLGLKKTVSVTSEGVLFSGVPYNSPALQRWADSAPSKVVTVYLDPDFPKEVTIMPEGSSEILEAELSMTALGGLTFLGMLEVMEQAAKSNPKTRHLHDEILQAARTRRVVESGYFSRADKPETWTLIEKLEQQSAGLMSVECVPPASGYRRANIMDRASDASIPTTRVSPGGTFEPPAAPPTGGSLFKKITESKL